MEPIDETFITGLPDVGAQYPRKTYTSLVPKDELNSKTDNVSQSTRLHHKMREMKEMDEKLSQMKEDYARRMALVKQGEARFIEKQRAMIEYLRKFKTFIVETDSKRARAEKKEVEERRQKELKQKEIEDLKARLEQLKRDRTKRIKKYEHYKKNKTYLEQVLGQSDQYNEIDELLTRYKILEQTNLDLQSASERVMKEMSKQQQDYQNLMKDKQNDQLMKNSDLARLMKKLEEDSNTASSLQSEVASVEQKNKDTFRKFSEVQAAVRNIHNRTQLYPTTLKSKHRNSGTTMFSGAGQTSGGNGGMTDTMSMEKEKTIDEDSGPNRDQKVLQHLMDLLEAIKEKLEDIEFVVETVEVQEPNSWGNHMNTATTYYDAHLPRKKKISTAEDKRTTTTVNSGEPSKPPSDELRSTKKPPQVPKSTQRAVGASAPPSSSSGGGSGILRTPPREPGGGK